MSEGEAYLDALASILEEIGALLGLGRDRYGPDRAVRLAVQRLWTSAGECARLYCAATGTEAGVEPWSALWGYRNVLVHHLPSDIDEELVWVEPWRDLPEHKAVIEALQGSTG